MTTVAHKVAVQIAVGVTGVGLLSALSKELLGAHLSANKLRTALTNLGPSAKLALGGLASMTAGLAMFSALKGPEEAAEKWQRAVTRFQILGLGDQANTEAVKFAQSMRIIGSSYTDNMDMLREAQGVFREAGMNTVAEQLSAAKMVAPTMAKLRMIDSTLDPESQGRYHHQELAMLRFAEQTGGLQSPQRMQELLDNGYKMIASSGGKNVDWEKLRQFKQNARAAGFNLNDEALFAKFEPLIGELKGGAGTALATAYQRLNGINTIMPRSAIDAYEKMGLWDMSKVDRGKFGRLSFKGNPLKQGELFSQDPVEFYNKFVRPYYDAHHVGAADRYRQNSILFGGTGGNLFNLVEKQAAVIEKSVAAQAKVLGINQSYDKAKNTIAGMKADAKTNFENANILVGAQLIPIVTDALKAFLPYLRDMVTWMTKNPGALKNMVGGFVALAGVLTVAGSIAAFAGTVGMLGKSLGVLGKLGKLGSVFGIVSKVWPAIVTAGEVIGGVFTTLAAVFGAPVWVVVAGAVAIGAAIAGLVWAVTHWSTVMKVFHDVVNATGNFFKGVGAKVTAWWHDTTKALGGFFDDIKASYARAWAAAKTGMSGLWDIIVNFFSNLPGNLVKGGSALVKGAGAAMAGAAGAVMNHGSGRGPATTPDHLPRSGDVHLTVHTHNYMDGREIAPSVTKHIVNELNRPVNGRTGWNPQMTPNLGGGR